MKKLQLLIYVVLLIIFISVYFAYGFDYYENNSLRCADYYDASYDFYTKNLYWEENNQCCKYKLINNSIMEYCENG